MQKTSSFQALRDAALRVQARQNDDSSGFHLTYVSGLKERHHQVVHLDRPVLVLVMQGNKLLHFDNNTHAIEPGGALMGAPRTDVSVTHVPVEGQYECCVLLFPAHLLSRFAPDGAAKNAPATSTKGAPWASVPHESRDPSACARARSIGGGHLASGHCRGPHGVAFVDVKRSATRANGRAVCGLGVEKGRLRFRCAQSRPLVSVRRRGRPKC